ncbi:hypothetical protein ACLOJK_035394 [Asimina triloba]
MCEANHCDILSVLDLYDYINCFSNLVTEAILVIVAADVSLAKDHFEKGFGSGTTTELSVSDGESESSAYGDFSALPSATSNESSIEENCMEPALELSRFPSFPGYGHQRREECQSQELCSPLLDCPFHKTVAVGPDHQADIPEYFPKDYSGCSQLPVTALSVSCAPDMGDDNSDLDNLTVSCISLASVAAAENVGMGRIDCRCPDKGSVRCVRQHVIEAREKLRTLLGQQRFVELGFCEMGEVVGDKWSEEEERVFHEVVFSNPQSSGKNFWDELSLVFPTRAKKDLVSYYYNVFMLRRRAEQNRLDSMDIDSDDDEWHGCDESESATTDDGEDSVMESLNNQGTLHNVVGETDFDEDDELGDDDYDSANGDTAGDEDGLHDSEGQLSDESTQNKWLYENLQNGSEDQNLQDESCTSSECLTGTISGPTNGTASGARSYQNNGAMMQEQQAKTDCRRWLCDFTNGSLTDAVDQGYTFETCNSKEWDLGFVTSPLKDFDSLPAWHMIEDVFGDATWTNSKIRDSPGIH